MNSPFCTWLLARETAQSAFVSRSAVPAHRDPASKEGPLQPPLLQPDPGRQASDSVQRAHQRGLCVAGRIDRGHTTLDSCISNVQRRLWPSARTSVTFAAQSRLLVLFDAGFHPLADELPTKPQPARSGLPGGRHQRRPALGPPCRTPYAVHPDAAAVRA